MNTIPSMTTRNQHTPEPTPDETDPISYKNKSEQEIWELSNPIEKRLQAVENLAKLFLAKQKYKRK